MSAKHLSILYAMFTEWFKEYQCYWHFAVDIEYICVLHIWSAKRLPNENKRLEINLRDVARNKCFVSICKK